jgi:orotate phosphoribosyltransferase
VKHEGVALALIGAGGLRFSDEEPFILASKKIGPVYVDVRRLTSTPAGWKAANEGLVDVVRGLGHVDAISGGELADLFFSIPVALELGLPHLTIRKQPKGHGTGGRLVGEVLPGEKFVHVSDLITSGTSAREWIDVVRGAGGSVQDYVVVFDRNQGGREALEKSGVRVRALLEMNGAFLSFVSNKGALAEEKIEGIRRYLADPEKWSGHFLRSNPEFLSERIESRDGRMTRSDGLDVLTQGYPELIPEIGEVVRKRLRDLGLDQSLVSSTKIRKDL